MGKEDALAPQGFDLLQRCEGSAPLHPVVFAKLLIHTKVARSLAEHGVGDAGQQRLLLCCKVHRINSVQIIGRASPGELGTLQPAAHLGKSHGLPVTVEVLVGYVVAVLAFDGFDALSNLRVGARVGRVGCQQLVREVQGCVDAADNTGTIRAQHFGVLGEQIAHRHHGSPARLGVVADVEHTAHLELAADEIDDHGAVLIRNPAPDAVQADVIELRQIGAGTELVEGFVKQLGTGFSHAGQLLSKSRLSRVEVGARPLHHAGSGVQVGAHALAEAQFAGAAHFRRHQARVQEGQPHTQRVQFCVVTVGVANVGHIAGSPVGHSVCLLGDVIDV